MLNSLRRFSAAAAAPILLNLVMIATMLIAWMRGWGDTPMTGYTFVWGVCAAGVVQFLLLDDRLPARRHSALTALAEDQSGCRAGDRASVPGIIAGGITQVKS